MIRLTDALTGTPILVTAYALDCVTVAPDEQPGRSAIHMGDLIMLVEETIDELAEHVRRLGSIDQPATWSMVVFPSASGSGNDLVVCDPRAITAVWPGAEHGTSVLTIGGLPQVVKAPTTEVAETITRAVYAAGGDVS